jgi:single-stranded DNA-binding protein
MIINEIGRLGRDAETITTKNGTTLLRYSLAVDEYNYETKQSETKWFNVLDSTEKSLKLKQYLTKGKLINIVGDYRDSIFNSQKGPVINRDVHVYNWSFINAGKNDANHSEEAPNPKEETNPEAVTGTYVPPIQTPVIAEPTMTEDLPF